MREALQNDISRSSLKGMFRHCQLENSCWPFDWPYFISNKFLSIFNIDANYQNKDWLIKRAILVVKNKDVDDLNTKFQSQINGQRQPFKSIDSITDPNEVANYPTEFLNSLDLPGFTAKGWVPDNHATKFESAEFATRNKTRI